MHNPVITFNSSFVHGGEGAFGPGVTFNVPYYSHIVGNLWTGAKPHAEAPAEFVSILNLYPWETYKVPAGVEYKEMQIYDGDDVDTAGFYGAADWIRQHIANGPLLVHCQAGINRSNTAAALYLMQTGMMARDAIALIRQKRSPLSIVNPAFERWLVNQKREALL